MPLLLACEIDTDVAGSYTLEYSVTNSQGYTVTANRTLLVKEVCPPGEFLCDNGVGLLQLFDMRGSTYSQAA